MLNHKKPPNFMNFKQTNSNMHRGPKIIQIINYKGKRVHAAFWHPKMKLARHNYCFNMMQQHMQFHGFVTIVKNIFSIKTKWKGKTTCWHCHNINLCNQIFSQVERATYLLQIYNMKSSRNWSCVSLDLLLGILALKNAWWHT
jgi:hypothetical protein